MGSQTLEILRQGVWASLTGGWFYDPHQNVFCNAVHLYLWMFLLCSPFVTYLYFPKTTSTWALYCLATSLTVAFVKCINLALHLMYDEAQIISEGHLKQSDSGADAKALRETCDENDCNGVGIEMQVMGSRGNGGATSDVGDCGTIGPTTASAGGSSMGLGHVSSTGIGGGDSHTHQHSNEISQANSAMSIEFTEQVVSTIDLKVDVHRKNSSESSDLSLVGGGLHGAKVLTATSVITHSADVCQTANHRRSFKTKSKSEEATGTAHHPHRSPISEEDLAEAAAASAASALAVVNHGLTTADETADQFVDIEAAIRDRQRKKLRHKLQRQSSLEVDVRHAHHLGMTRSIDQFNRMHKHRSNERVTEQQRQRDVQHVQQMASYYKQCAIGSSPSDLYYIPDDDGEYDDDDCNDDEEDDDHEDDDDDRGDCDDDDRDKYIRRLHPAYHQQLYRHQLHQHHHRHHHQQHRTPMRKDSNSTMSALQLPTTSAAAAQRVRRHSNAIGKGGGGSGKSGGNGGGDGRGHCAHGSTGSTASMTSHATTATAATVRRIKSAALETCCPQPSVSNLAPHPSSVETLGSGGATGVQQLRNPKHAMLPPPSKSLVRNAHANMALGGSGDCTVVEPTAALQSQIVELVGAVAAEEAAKRAGSMEFVSESSSESDSEQEPEEEGEEDDNNVETVKREEDDDNDDDEDDDDDDPGDRGAYGGTNRQPSRPNTLNVERTQSDTESDCDRPQTAHSASDSDTENNAGSQSPLLDQKSRSAVYYGGGSKSTGAIASSSATAAVTTTGDKASGMKAPSQSADHVPAGGSVAFASPENMDDMYADDDDDLDDMDAYDDMAGAVGGELIAVDEETLLNLIDSVKVAAAVAATAAAAAAAIVPNPKSEDSGCPSSDGDQASASSKDMLLSACPSGGGSGRGNNDRNWFDFRMDSNSICVDVTEPPDIADTAGPADRPCRNVSTNTPHSTAATGAIPKRGQSSTANLHPHPQHRQRHPQHQQPPPPPSSLVADSNTPPEMIEAYREYMESLQLRASTRSPTDDTYDIPPPIVSHHRAPFGQTQHSAEGYPVHWTDTPMYPGSRASSWSSSPTSRRCSVDSVAAGVTSPAAEPPPLLLDALGRTQVDVLQRTRDGRWTLQSTAANAPPPAALTPNDDQPPPLIPIYSARRPSVVCFPPAPPPAMRPLTLDMAVCSGPSRVAASASITTTSAARHRASFQTKLRLSARQRHSHHHGHIGGSFDATAAAMTSSMPFTSSAAEGAAASGSAVAMAGRPRYSQDPIATWDYKLTTSGGVSCGSLQLELHAPVEMGARERAALRGRIDGGSGGGSSIRMAGSSDAHNCVSGALAGAAGGHHAAGVANMAASTDAGGLSVTGNVNGGGSGPLSLGADFGEAVFCDYWRHYNLPPEKLATPRRVYRYPVRWFGGRRRDIKVRMDRLQLLALLDRDLGWWHALLGIALAAAVSALGAAVLRMGVFRDVYAFCFCFVMAGSQYSLLKSVQPDAASPVHGFNKMVAFSRPIYFCMLAGLLLVLHRQNGSGDPMADDYRSPSMFTLFAVDVWPADVFETGETLMALMLLMLPVFFSLGLFPQINTFLMYALEQLDMHVFGGSAVCSLLAAFVAVLRSLLACSVLYGPAYGGLAEPRGTQHVLYSAFCGLLVAVSYHLSRSASDVSCVWALIKRALVLHTEDDEEQAVATAAGMRRAASAEESDEEVQQLNRRATAKPKNRDQTTANDADDNNDDVVPTVSPDQRTVVSPTLSTAHSQPATTSTHPRSTLAISMPVSPQSVKSNADRRSVGGNSTAHRSRLPLKPGDRSDDDGTPDSSKPVDPELEDPLPRKLQQTVNARLTNDALVCIVISTLVFGLHCSTVFTVLQPELVRLLIGIVSVLGLVLHYVVPQMRKHLPWLWLAGPLLRSADFDVFEPRGASEVMWFERVYVYACFVERNVLYPLVFVAALTADGAQLAAKWGVPVAALIVVVCGLKGVRSAYADPASQYLIFVFAVLLFACDFKAASETLLVDYFVMAIVFKKMCEFMLKLQFIVTYIAPWQITWGSAFHAFAQPFSVPHSAMLFVQAAISAVLSTPLNPFLGSAIFLTSYVRPIKFWERDYNTKRIDHSNTRLSSQLERDLGADDNNLNSIFYEHLTRSLQHSLCGDLLLGRWGNVSQGDCFVLASDYLNCLVHIIELGNGLCTFQMRGLEFRGTYCQQREVEAISEGVQENEGCCCCAPGHLPRMLSVNAMFATRWLAWQVVASKYVLEGYSISDNLAQATLQVFEFRKVLITYYVKSIIYYTIRSPKLDEWLQSPAIQEVLRTTLERNFVDLDPIFNHNLDEDFDFRAAGITRHSFCSVYMTWIQFCYGQRFAPKVASTPVNVEPTSTAAGAQATGASGTLIVPPSAATTAPVVPIRTSSSSTGGSNNLLQNSAGGGSSSADNNTAAASAAPPMVGHKPRAPPRTTSSQQRTPSPRAHKRRSRSEKSASSASASSAKRQHRQPQHSMSQHQSHGQSSGQRGSGRGHTDTEPPLPNATGESAASLITRDSPLVSLLLCLGLLGRRTLATASHNNSLVTVVELFLHGLHALFKGDFRITSQRDEWVFADMDLLHSVVAPAVKMALKLHQDHFLNPDEFDDLAVLYAGIETHTRELVISHEADPLWRSAVLRGAPHLLALRHVMEDGSDEYRLIRLTKRFLGFRVIKVNRECVRGLWAGQQQELIYLRNRNPERGSIQNAKQALRNIINSSCDQPIGYPIYVSPLTTSYADTNEQLGSVIGGAITLERIHQQVRRLCQRVRKRCREGCSSGSVTLDTEMGGGNAGSGGVGLSAAAATAFGSGVSADMTGSAGAGAVTYCGNASGMGGGGGGAVSSGGVTTVGMTLSSYGSQGLSLGMGLGSGAGTRGSTASVGKPTSNTALLAGFLSRDIAATGLAPSPTAAAAAPTTTPMPTTATTISERSVKRRSSSSTGRQSQDRRTTQPLPDATSQPTPTKSAAEPAYTSAAAAAAAAASSSLHQHAMHLKPSSFSAGHLSAKGSRNAPLGGAADRKSKSEERQQQQLQRQQRAMAMTTAAATSSPAPPRIALHRKVIIVDREEIFDCLDLGRRIDVSWPSEAMRAAGGQLAWQDWQPLEGMVGYVRHYWQPGHPEPAFRSNFNRTLLLVQVGERFVPVGEHGVREYNTGGGGGGAEAVGGSMAVDSFRSMAEQRLMDKTLAIAQTSDTKQTSGTEPSESTGVADEAAPSTECGVDEEVEAEIGCNVNLETDGDAMGASTVIVMVEAVTIDVTAEKAAAAQDVEDTTGNGAQCVDGPDVEEGEADSETGDHFVLSNDD